MDYWPEVIQVIPVDGYKVFVYFDDGNIKLYDASKIITSGLFRQLKEGNLFFEACTVLNGTLAWTLDFKYDPTTCLDIDPFVIYETCQTVVEPKELFAS